MDELSGRELDKAIAERVFGDFFRYDTHCGVCGWYLASKVNPSCRCTPESCSLRPPPSRRADEPCLYSTNIAAAWRVVERMIKRGFQLNMFVSKERCVANFFYPNRLTKGEIYKTAPLAICRAALKALEEK